MVEHETRNDRLLAFLDNLRGCDWDKSEDGEEVDSDVDVEPALVAETDRQPKLGDAVSAWIKEQYSDALAHLRPPSADDFSTFFQLALGAGGLSYIRDRYVRPSMCTCQSLAEML